MFLERVESLSLSKGLPPDPSFFFSCITYVKNYCEDGEKGVGDSMHFQWTDLGFVIF